MRTLQVTVFGHVTVTRGDAAMRLNVCSRFRSSEVSVAPYPMTQLKAPLTLKY